MTKLKQVQKSAAGAKISKWLGNPHSISFLYPASRHMCSSADKEDGDRHVMWSNDQAEAGAKISKWLGNPHSISFLYPAPRHMCSSADKEVGDRHVMWSDDQAEAGAKISKWLGNPHSISFLYPSGGTKFMLLEKLYKTSISVNRGSHFQVRFVWQVWDGQSSPSFKYIRF